MYLVLYRRRRKNTKTFVMKLIIETGTITTAHKSFGGTHEKKISTLDLGNKFLKHCKQCFPKRFLNLVKT